MPIGQHQPQEANWKSDFSMGMFDFERLHEIKMELDRLCFRVSLMNADSADSLVPYWAALNAFYTAIYPILRSDERADIEVLLDYNLSIIPSARAKGGRINVFPHRQLITMHRGLYRTAQFHGLGIVVDRTRSEEENLALAFRNKREKKPE